MSRTVVAVPDLHGRLDLLEGVVERFPDAHLLSLGDAIDRGPQSLLVTQRLMELRAEGRATLLMGNHERMASEGLNWYRRYQGTHDLGDYRRAIEGLNWWTRNGGESVRRELGGGLTLEQFPAVLSDYLDVLRRVVYVTDDGVVHDGLPSEPSVLLSHASPPVRHRAYPDPQEALLWLRPYEGPFELPTGVVYSVHGHTPVRVPLRLGRHVYLDMGAYETGLLALLPITVQTLSPATVLMGRGDPSKTARFPMMGEAISARSEPLPGQAGPASRPGPARRA